MEKEQKQKTEWERKDWVKRSFNSFIDKLADEDIVEWDKFLIALTESYIFHQQYCVIKFIQEESRYKSFKDYYDRLIQKLYKDTINFEKNLEISYKHKKKKVDKNNNGNH